MDQVGVQDQKLTVLGNLNGIEMRRWTPAQAEAIVKEAIVKAGPGGGFILSDNHGEIPWQVPDEVLAAISKATGLESTAGSCADSSLPEQPATAMASEKNSSERLVFKGLIDES